MHFKLKSNYQPTGDQPQAIKKLTTGLKQNLKNQVLLGVTGSGKTYSMANVIQNIQQPTLVISHNKTLAAQLYQEFRDFFPENAVSYFVSYYDYYQPEAYVPSTDTYIAKETDINQEIDKLRLSATTHLLTRPDVIVVASVSCIYNLGSPIEYGKYILQIVEGQLVSRDSLFQRLIDLQYDRSHAELRRGSFRVKGDTIQLWPAYDDYALKITTFNDQIEKITPIDPISGKPLSKEQSQQSHLDNEAKKYIIYPAKHYLTNPKTQQESIQEIRRDLDLRLKEMETQGKNMEAYRLKQKVTYDLEMIEEFGFVSGIENYSRYFDGRKPGDPPYTLIDYFHHNIELFDKSNFLTIVDESHITVPQIGGMYAGDQSRKQTLIDFGFRLPSALDNRPLKFDEFQRRLDQTVFVSATPNDWEVSQARGRVIEQIIRPTGLIDPEVEIRPSEGQIENLAREILKRKAKSERVLVTTLTKRMAEDLTEYLNDQSNLVRLLEDEVVEVVNLPKVAYLHADVDTLDRSDILDDLRKGTYDVLVGINLLREGLDLPEVSLVAILDADKEGFLRSRTSLIQVMGRAARHKDGHVIMYADNTTKSMQLAIDEVNRRRDIQAAYNLEHNITPETIQKPIRKVLIKREKPDDSPKENTIRLSKNQTVDLSEIRAESLTPDDKAKLIKSLQRRMNQAAKELDFELAAQIRDKIEEIETGWFSHFYS